MTQFSVCEVLMALFVRLRTGVLLTVTGMARTTYGQAIQQWPASGKVVTHSKPQEAWHKQTVSHRLTE